MTLSITPALEVTNTPVKHAIDFFAGAGIVSTVMGWLPVVALLVPIAWYVYQAYDLWDKRRQRAALRKRRKKGG